MTYRVVTGGVARSLSSTLADARVTMVSGPLPPGPPYVALHVGAGALLEFEGVVRPTEGDATIAALRYEDYAPMTERSLMRLAEGTLVRFGLLAIHAEHSVGLVPSGAVSFRLAVAARHRREAIAAVDDFIETMKRDVPLWKVPVFADAPADPLDTKP